MSNTRPRILAIDDTPANLLTLGTALASSFDLQIATSGAMGIALASESPPDLILLDVMMPEMDGHETCRRIMAEPRLQMIPVIFLTALTSLEDEIAGLALGAADYITKPINVELARHRIRNLLDRERLRKDIEAQRDLLSTQIVERERAEKLLAESRNLLLKIIDTAPVRIYWKDRDSCYLGCNAAFAMDAGRERERAIPGAGEHLCCVL